MTLFLTLMTTTTAWAVNYPKGHLDIYEGVGNSIHINGWAFDPEYPAVSIYVSIAVYTNSSCTNRLTSQTVITDVPRPDVNQVYNITGVHGFDVYIPVENAGTYYVSVYANGVDNTFGAVNDLKTVTVTPLPGGGTLGNPYIISNTRDWAAFAANVRVGIKADKYYKLADGFNNSDSPVTQMIGYGNNPFRGHFLGNGRTLHVNMSGSEQGTAPFHNIDGGRIENLTVEGTVTSTAYHCSGLVGLCGSSQTNVVKNCTVNVNVNGSSYGGGIVGHGGEGILNMVGCVFGGTINGCNRFAGGLLGWCNELELFMYDCLFKGNIVASGGGLYHPIALKYGVKTVTATTGKLYYLNTAAPSEGLGANSIPGAEGTPVSSSIVDGIWEKPVTAADGITYYAASPSGINLPYEYGFETALNTEGWTVVNGIDGTGISQEIKHKGANGFKFMSNGSNQYLISPEFKGINGMKVSFYVKNLIENGISYTAAFQIGVSVTTKDISAFSWTSTMTVTDGKWLTLNCDSPKGTKYIAIKAVGNSYNIYLDDFTFTESIPPTTPQQLTTTEVASTRANLSWTGDAESYNVRFRPAPLFFDDFEKGIDHWTIRHNGQGTANTDWRVLDIFPSTGNYLTAHSGDYVAYARSWDPDMALSGDVDNWLISPQVTLDGILKLWARNDGENIEHFEIMVSTTTNQTSAFTKIAEPNNVYSQWKEVSVDLSQYNGAKGYIAIRLKDFEKNYMCIDDIGIYPGEWTTVSASEESLMLNGLNPLTAYEFQVQGIKGAIASDWSDTATFTTLAPIPTVINDTAPLKDRDEYYTLEGVRVDKITKKGIYIVNGKKVVVK